MSGRRGIGRRNLIGGVSMLILVAAEAGVAKAEELDGELLAACRQYHHLHSQESPINAQIRAASREQHASLWEALEALWDQQDDILVVITDLRAKTPEGLRAKALVADVVTRRRQKMEIENDCLTDEHRLNLSLIADLLERKVG